MKKRNVLLSSILVIALCLSVIVGSTFALFTDTDSVNVAVESGRVDISAEIADTSLRTWSLEIEQPYGTFANGGTASFSDAKNLDIALMTPGDKLQFEIVVENNSNVHTLYRIRAVSNLAGQEIDLAPALTIAADIMVNNTPAETINIGSVDGDYAASTWVYYPANADYSNVIVTIEFPDAPDNNDFMDKKANFTFLVDAVQGNAATNNLTESFKDGGYISSGNVPNYVKDGEDLMIPEAGVTLDDIVLIHDDANSASYLLGMDGTSGTLTLEEGAIIETKHDTYGILMQGSKLVINDGAKIKASGNNMGAAVMVTAYSSTTIELNGSDWFDLSDGGKAIWVQTGIGETTININTTDYDRADYASDADFIAACAEYLDLVTYDPNTVAATVHIYVNGIQIK